MTDIKDTSKIDHQNIQEVPLAEANSSLVACASLVPSDTQSIQGAFSAQNDYYYNPHTYDAQYNAQYDAQYNAQYNAQYDALNYYAQNCDTQNYDVLNTTSEYGYWTAEVESYVQQFRLLFSNPEQYYDNVDSVCQKYSPRLLQLLETAKVREWDILNSIFHLRTIQQIKFGVFDHTKADANITDIITHGTPTYYTQLSPLESYQQQCNGLLTNEQTYYDSIRIVGNNCLIKTLEQLVAYKNQEWKILCNMYTKRAIMIGRINFTIKSIINLVVPIHSWNAGYTDDNSDQKQKFEQRQEEFVFGAGTAAATRIFTRALTEEKLTAFHHGLINLIQMLYEALITRNPSQFQQDQVQVIIANGKALDNRADICDTTLVDFANISIIINLRYPNLRFSVIRRTIISLSTTTLLLLYKYIQAMQHEIAAVQTDNERLTVQ